MRSKGNAPTADQKRFRENLRDLYPGSVIHHCVGVSGKHNKVEIGHWWIVAISERDHRTLHGAVGSKNKGWRKETEKDWYITQMISYFQKYHRMPVPDQVLEAIEDYHL